MRQYLNISAIYVVQEHSQIRTGVTGGYLFVLRIIAELSLLRRRVRLNKWYCKLVHSVLKKP